MSFDNRVRRVGTITGAESSAVSLDLPRKNLYRDLILWLKGSLVIATAGSPVLYTGGIGSGLKMVERVEVIANGRDTLKSLSLSALAMKNMILFGSKPQITETGLTAATHPFGGVVHLPFAMPRAIREIDTLLNTGKLATLELRATFGTFLSSMFSTDPTAVTAGSSVANLEVYVNEAIRLDGKDEPYSAYKELYIEKDIVAAAAEFQILLPVGNRYRGFLIECESDGEMVDTILKKVTIKSGTDVYKAIDAYEGTTYKPAGGALRGDNIKCFGLNAETLVGYYYVDFCPEGRMVDALDASRLSSLEMVLDVAAPGTTDKVRVYPCEIVPPMPA